jgi:uncharacterized membrane protein YgdD (TMEM256/DUF423 family)
MRVIAALCGFVAVALGAFGAHALRPTLSALATADTWATASLYHLVHSAVLMCIAMARPTARMGYWLFLLGIGLFSGSLYAFALTGARSLAMLAPVGGACLLAGWISLAFHGESGVDDDAKSG